MPAQRPCASFDPISPDLDLATLVEETPNFEYVVRISCDMIDHQGLEAFEKLVLLHVIIGGRPLVVEGFQDRLDPWTFTPQWLRDNQGTKFEQARTLTKQENIALSINHYLNNMAMLTNQWNIYNYKEWNRQRVYLKDIDCPQVWHDKLKEQIPPGLFYLNESTGDIGGPGAADVPELHGPGVKKGRGIARAGDLMSCLPPPMRAENMMCYIGHEGTYTPAHREMCASLGQNIMVETSGTVDEDGKPAKPGSSIWFMTETKDRHLVSEYWLSTLGHDIEVESHFAQINAWKAAPFTTYVVEQKVGDFILIPPLAPHQVWNRGTRTMKAAWNRTTVETLEMALSEALPRARMVCRDEQYKNKAIVLFALQKYSGLLKEVDLQKQDASDQQAELQLIYSPKIRQLQKDFKRLFTLYTQILLSEMLSPASPTEKKGQYLPYDSNVTCSYCRCNIFNRFLTCTSCVIPLENGEKDTYDICMECFVMGRSCQCLSRFKWVEQFPWTDLVEKHDLWRHQIIAFDGGLNEKSPQPLHLVRKDLKHKTLAQICQEQLKARPWRDPEKPVFKEVVSDDLEEDQVNDDGTAKKKRKMRRSEKWLREHLNCHICKKREPTWKLAICGCGTSYCFGSLFRAFDLMPVSVMQDPDWKCPRCLKICSCAGCRAIPDVNPFEPNGTVLGHDTKKIADPRSIESLVDFSHSNIKWVKKAGDDHPHETKRLKRRGDEAAEAKSKDPELDDNYVDEDFQPLRNPRFDAGIIYTQNGDVPIDPQLSMDYTAKPTNSNAVNNKANGEHAGNSTVTANGNYNDPSGIRGPLPSGASMVKEAPSPPVLQRDAAPSVNSNGIVSHADDNAEHLNGQSGFHRHHMPGPHQFVAPAAMMVNPNPTDHLNRTADANGTAYEYPDPSMPEMTTSSQATRFRQPVVTVQHEGQSQAGTKRKRSDDRPRVRSDFIESPKNDANRQFQEAQIQRTLAEARNNDRSISARAAMPGQKLDLKLSVNGAKVAEMVDETALKRRSTASGLGEDGAGDDREDTIILQSDLPGAAEIIVIPEPLPPKKKKVKVENDQAFTAGKSETRRSARTRAVLSKGIRKPRAEYAEISDNSESEGGVPFREYNGGSQRKAPKSRQLPSYLARRSLGEEAEFPKELPLKPRRRPSRQKKTERSRPAAVTEAEPEETDSLIGSQASTSPIDLFQAEAVPTSSTDVHVSMLGPGGTDVQQSEIEIQRDDIETRQNNIDSQPHSPNLTDPDPHPTPTSDPAKRAADNRRAKLNALRWAEDPSDDQWYSSKSASSEEDSSLDEPAMVANRAVSGGGRTGRAGVGDAGKRGGL
ncbi:JmjC domain [Lasallia pustulata]|uniref:JmjC domain n=1 Tax=Lasallia pustulata TaxID=136370 RepID=A0A1W5DBY1_9LECA|nr:JmjC domain [Lasallia pustulata]